jgi:hypothetical protein
MATSSLTTTDFGTTTWKRTKSYFQSRVTELREQLEMDADEIASAKLRGRIAELNQMLGLEKAPASAPRTGARLSVDDLLPSHNDGEP